jgi:hypothetical protein
VTTRKVEDRPDLGLRSPRISRQHVLGAGSTPGAKFPLDIHTQRNIILSLPKPSSVRTEAASMVEISVQRHLFALPFFH